MKKIIVEKVFRIELFLMLIIYRVGLRDFNSDSDMLLADHVGSGIYGLSGMIVLTGFSRTAIATTKIVRGDIWHLSSIESFSTLSQSVGTFNKLSPPITGIRFYFGSGTFLDTGYISLLKINNDAG